jgi:hypothetical protein
MLSDEAVSLSVERGSQPSCPSLARVDGLEPLNDDPRERKGQAIFLGATEPRAPRPGKNPPRGRCLVGQDRLVGVNGPKKQVVPVILVTPAEAVRLSCCSRGRYGDNVPKLPKRAGRS